MASFTYPNTSCNELYGVLNYMVSMESRLYIYIILNHKFIMADWTIAKPNPASIPWTPYNSGHHIIHHTRCSNLKFNILWLRVSIRLLLYIFIIYIFISLLFISLFFYFFYFIFFLLLFVLSLFFIISFVDVFLFTNSSFYGFFHVAF